MMKNFLAQIVFAIIVLCHTQGHAIELTEEIENQIEEVKQQAKSNTKIGDALQRILGSEMRAATDVAGLHRGTAQIPGDKIRVHIYVKDTGEEVLKQLGSFDGRVEIVNHELRIVQFMVSRNSIAKLEILDDVLKIKLPKKAYLNSGLSVTEADALLNAPEVREIGKKGRGIKVLAISNGADNLADAQATNDLPAAVAVLTPTECGWKGGCNEGTAMLEIIHDIAPEATLGICGVNNDLEFIECVRRGIDGDFDIIVDDVGFFLEPFFEDGLVAQQVMRAVHQGVLFVSASGNMAKNYYQADFVPSAQSSGATLHDFGAAAGGASMSVFRLVLNPGQTVMAILQWDDAFGESGDDLDLLVFVKNTEGKWVFIPGISGLNMQNGDDNPLETISFRLLSSATEPLDTAIAVLDKTTSQERKLKLVFLPDSEAAFVSPEYITASGSIFGHAAVPGVLTVGAINVHDYNIDDIAGYSGQGPVQIAIPMLEYRSKPDIIGLDCTTVSGAGGFYSPFCGTSAAAPHIAGLAALLLGENNDPSVEQPSVSSVISALKETAVDLGTPGRDNIYGAGRADVLAASGKLDRENRKPTVSGNDISTDLNFEVVANIALTGFGTLELTVTSSNTVLLPDAGISGQSNCTEAGSCSLVLTPATGQSGKTTITMTVTDAAGRSDTGQFVLLVNAPPDRTPAVLEEDDSGGEGSSGGGAFGLWFLLLSGVFVILSGQRCRFVSAI